MNFYSPAQASQRSGFSLDTLRYYEKIGLLAGVARDSAGRRRFSDDDLTWLRLLRCLRDTGMPIAEMLRYTELARAGEHTAAERRALLEEHDRRVAEQIDLLSRQREHIQWKIGIYRELTAPAPAADPVSA
ncbi:DNA-binding transcriptional regulator, MerR family [Thermomonospora echinospora]|uniref:DNA-binding transcriptional regulator, MerR family n=1 Tax=Thermomonospora echinospora TaxID=1992 RepID=A0A1H6BID2_9ACTN|nr:MerR family transcriptional regulator [Thermomonospora echinospora]SEG59966.1 DNA-binding transcriptional regulator, MerR family [Thermomonospora echinospora]